MRVILIDSRMKRTSGPVYSSGERYVSRRFVPPMPNIVERVV